jgi:hypothetical protein
MSPSSTLRKLRVWLSKTRKMKAQAAKHHVGNNMQATPASNTQPLRTIEPRTHNIEACAEFSYTPIDDLFIRLITVQPGSGDDLIECTLSTYDLQISHDKGIVGPYETLSYVWGDPTQQRKILCDGALVSITKSLYDALKAVRFPAVEGPRTLW